jgi:cell division protein FtsB
MLLLAAVMALTILLALIGRQLYVDSRDSGDQLAGLKRENATLRADLARARTELNLERSTRAALVRQVAALSEEKSQLARRLDFIDAQTGPSKKPR